MPHGLPNFDKPDIYPNQGESDIRYGTVFDTETQTHCIALDKPDIYGNFDGIDPEGIVVSFSVKQVILTRLDRTPLIRL